MRTVLVLLLGLCGAFSLSMKASAEDRAPTFGPDSSIALNGYRGMVEEHINGVIRSLRVIALSDEAKSGSWDKVKPFLERFSEDLTTDATTWFAHPDGRYFSTAQDDVTEENLKDRDYFPTLMSGKEVFGDLVISKSTGHRSVIVAVPVKQDDKTIGAVGVSLRVRLLSELVNATLQLPADTYFYALDRDTRIVLHRNAERMFKTPTDVGDETLGAEFKRALQQKSGTFDYELQGKKISSIFESSPKLGWYFFIARELGA
jgi:hypothetical protein